MDEEPKLVDIIMPINLLRGSLEWEYIIYSPESTETLYFLRTVGLHAVMRRSLFLQIMREL